MKRKTILHTVIFLLILLPFKGQLQEAQNDQKNQLNAKTFSGLKFRSIGPALMSGRIADIAIHPEDEYTWFVAVGSGGVWKTENSGITWDPVFDKEKSYSIGCLTIDPLNPNTVWVGTGENVGGRHVGYGDGIYKSEDGGATWKNMGLKESQHISKVIVHPENSDVIWVAAQGPLWNKGGERGFYKSADGGKTWKKTLGDDEWVGVTDIVYDPRNPELIYAATWQRHRNVASYIGGGPGSGIHRSTDGGETWENLKTGLPESNMGKIGLAISSQNPDVLYAAIELDRRSGGLYRSDNRGASWKKMSEAVSGATGPHYYQELYASPHRFDRIYLMDVRVQVSEDGGKTFKHLKEKNKHSDNHVLAFRKDEPDYLLLGTDGGLYESFDLAENWRFIANLPVTQFYKVAVDDAEPFYHIYGGTQDNSTQGGPSRTDNRQGIRNSDWFLTLGGDGHQPATEPGNPNIVYSQSQEGELHRIDMITGEKVYIKPQPGPGEPYERNNWDSPILVSPHSPTRLYFASQRLWRSDDRGNSWAAISGDLTRSQERMTIPIMDKTWSWDSPWDFEAMSNYNTITSIAESPVQENLIYIGTDDGLIQVTENGGGTWRKIEVGSLPGVPATAFVNDIKADLFNASTVYIALDNHKFGDLNPYLFKSNDKGKTWTSIKGNLPERTLVWRLVQDHVKPDLLFAATECGIYFTIDGGEKWIEFTGGIPSISFRDLAIQRRENDLVGASFGRGFYILDDYSSLRNISEEALQEKAILFQPDTALWYTEKQELGYNPKANQGASFFTAPNPPFGAVFTYFLKDSYETKKELREKEEKEKIKQGEAVKFPGWEAVEAERIQEEPEILLIIRDDDGNIVRKIKADAKKGIHRIAWDLRYPSNNVIEIEDDEDEDDDRSGYLAVPGSYSVTLALDWDGKITILDGPQNFEVVTLRTGALEAMPFDEQSAYRIQIEKLNKSVSASGIALKNAIDKVEAIRKAIDRTPVLPGSLDSIAFQLKMDLLNLDAKLNGNRSKREVGEKNDPTIRSRMSVAAAGTRTTYGPTQLHRQSYEIAVSELAGFKEKLEEIRTERIPALERQLIETGGPWIEGQPIPGTN
ncbi:MAG: hypothetical protein JW731_06980 [Bacteroidales bacterium]|nr:hypothetical protein [Bacteroidales bacterium]